jgi:hypothetical protein
MVGQPYNSPSEADLQNQQAFSAWANDININGGPMRTSASMNGTAQLAATSYSVSDILQGTFNVRNPADPLLIINNALTQDLGFLNQTGRLQANARLSGGYTGGMNTDPAGTAFGGMPRNDDGTSPIGGGGGFVDGDGVAGAITEEAVLQLPADHAITHAKIWKKKGKASIEMHLGITNINERIAPSPNDGHKQLSSLPPEKRYPYYMDRIGGWAGGEDYNAGPLEGGTIGSENASLPGSNGAFGVLSAEDEQFYCAMPWPTNSVDVKAKFSKAGMPEINSYVEQWDVKKSAYLGRRILVYSTKTKKACVCTPGDWGPNPYDASGSTANDAQDGFIMGLSPDTYQVLGVIAEWGVEVVVGWVDDTTPLGAYNPNGLSTGNSGTGTGAAKAIAWGETQMGAKYAAVRPFSLGEPPWPGGTIGGYGPFPAGTIVYDCSGFVIACWRKAGIDFGKSPYNIGSSGQFNTPKIPDAPQNDLKPGDIVAYSPPPGSSIGHVVLIHHIEESGEIRTLESSGSHGVWIGKLVPARAICYKRPALLLPVSDADGPRNV